jgi:hypothetical protein
MHIRSDDRSLFKIYIVAVTGLFTLYIIPVILFSFMGMEISGIPDVLKDIGETVYHIFFLIGVPSVSLLLGALSIGVLVKGAEAKTHILPRYIGYLMLFVTLLSMIIWIIDLSVYQGLA